MRSAQDVSVRWRVSCSLALVLLLRLARCKPVPELESWWMVDFVYLDGIHNAFTLPADDEAAQLVRHVYWREAGHMWSALMKALALLQTAWIHLQGRGPLHTHVLAGWHVFRQRAMSAFCDADIQELRNAMGSDCADWRSCAVSAVTCEHPKQSSYVVIFHVPFFCFGLIATPANLERSPPLRRRCHSLRILRNCMGLHTSPLLTAHRVLRQLKRSFFF